MKGSAYSFPSNKGEGGKEIIKKWFIISGNRPASLSLPEVNLVFVADA